MDLYVLVFIHIVGSVLALPRSVEVNGTSAAPGFSTLTNGSITTDKSQIFAIVTKNSEVSDTIIGKWRQSSSGNGSWEHPGSTAHHKPGDSAEIESIDGQNATTKTFYPSVDRSKGNATTLYKLLAGNITTQFCFVYFLVLILGGIFMYIFVLLKEADSRPDDLFFYFS